MRDTPTKAWICSICGYIHYGDQPPAECPMCGADSSMFEPYVEEVLSPMAVPAQGSAARRYVIVGAGIAGVSAAEAARKADPAAEILLFHGEAGLPYWRMNLTRYLAGEMSGHELDLHPREWYDEQCIQLRSGMSVSAIDLAGKAVFAGEQRISYDKLILACGANPFVPPIPGADLPQVTTLRTRADADKILATCTARAAQGETPRVVCIGGGILGLEAAGALSCRGAQVTVLENQDWLLSRQLNRPASIVFEQYLKDLNIHTIAKARVSRIMGAEDGSVGVALEGVSAPIPADLVVISAGVRANAQLARGAGLEVKNGVLVDEYMQTSQPDVYAAGDLAESQGVLYGLWAPAQAQGTVAGSSAAGAQASFHSLPPAATLKVLGIELFSIGAVNDPAARLVDAASGQSYTGFLFKDGMMTGAILLGDAKLARPVKKAVEERQDFSQLLSQGAGCADIRQTLA
jgi:nitrite reductase (NADH) large subunit